MVEAEVERDGKLTIARRRYLSSLDARLPHAPCAPIDIENRLHCVMDVVFHANPMRLRTDHGPANMTIVRHTCSDLSPASIASPSSENPQDGTTHFYSAPSLRQGDDLQAIPLRN